MMDSFYLIMLLTTQLLLDSFLVGAQNTNFSFLTFPTTDSFLMFGDIEHDATNSSFTMTPIGTSMYYATCGKLFYKDPVRVKDSASGAVASFHTSFTFAMYSPLIYRTQLGWLYADGITFTFGRNSTFLGQDAGGTFCLLKWLNNGLASNRLFAVEFDSYQDLVLNDTSNNHIGVNINSVNSTWSYNLCEGGEWKSNCTYFHNAGFFTAWIDYDSASQMLQVFLANGALNNDIQKPPNPLINVSLALAPASLFDLVDDYMYVGFTASVGAWGQLHNIQSWTFTSSGMPELNNSLRREIGIHYGVISAAAVAAMLLLATLLLLGFIIARNRKQDKIDDLAEHNQPVPREFTYNELKKATKNFRRSELLGSGGTGEVYRGTLSSGALVAVKRLTLDREKNFTAEFNSLTEIEPHPNLVQLMGYVYHKEEHLLLVYDYMSNGSLDKWLFRNPKSRKHRKQDKDNIFPLNRRYSVLQEVAEALLYLHEECPRCVLHRDIKSSNVLLDDYYSAHLGDFGLAMMVTTSHNERHEPVTEGGTKGYMAPEIPHTGQPTKESDVYSFGVLMLEVTCGRRPLDTSDGKETLVRRVWKAHEDGNILQVIDSRLGAFPLGNSTSTMPGGDVELQEGSHVSRRAQDAARRDKALMTNLLQVGLLCCNPNPEDRPKTKEVARLVQAADDVEMQMPALPTRRPEAHYGGGPASHRTSSGEISSGTEDISLGENHARCG